jgi:putative methyltransferase (TIGR04325 family)
VQAKRIIIGLTPPLLLNALLSVRNRVRRGGSHNALPDWEMVADDDQSWSGWDHSSIAETQVAKWSSFMQGIVAPRPVGQPHEASALAVKTANEHNKFMTFAYAIGRVAAARPAQTVRILDWGGGIGHYASIAKQLYPEIGFDYVVKDLPALCEAGRQRQPAVTFLDRDEDVFRRRYDLVFASSSLQYSRDIWSVLKRLCAVTEWLMITRTPFVKSSNDFVVVQRPYSFGYMTQYACWFLNEDKMLKFLELQGFQLEREFIVDENPYVSNAPEQGIYKGFLFRRGVLPSEIAQS